MTISPSTIGPIRPLAPISDPRALVARACARGWLTISPQSPSPEPHQTPLYLLGQRSRPAPADIVTQVLDWYGLSGTVLHKRTRRAPIVWVRHVALHLLQDIHGLSEHESAAVIGVSRDIAHIAKRAVANRIASYPQVASDLQALRARILAPRPSVPSVP